MANRGNPSLLFGSTTVTAVANCLQTAGITRNGNPIQYVCNGVNKSVPGVATYAISFSIAVSSDDVAAIAAFAENVTGAVEFHPGGDTAGNLEVTSTNGTVATSDLSADPSAVQTMSVTINLDDYTAGAAV